MTTCRWTTQVASMADRFRALSDPARLQILLAIGQREVNVQEICHQTGLKQPNVSKHLRVLRDIDAIACRQHSYYHYYRIVDPYILRCWHCTQTACDESGEHNNESNTHSDQLCLNLEQIVDSAPLPRASDATVQSAGHADPTRDRCSHRS
jgi:DNA-binding transcriptional ArsR family regulator